MVAAAVVLGAMGVLGFAVVCLALRQVRPVWVRMRASVGRWVSFSVEMDGRAQGARSEAGGDGGAPPSGS